MGRNKNETHLPNGKNFSGEMSVGWARWSIADILWRPNCNLWIISSRLRAIFEILSGRKFLLVTADTEIMLLGYSCEFPAGVIGQRMTVNANLVDVRHIVFSDTMASHAMAMQRKAVEAAAKSASFYNGAESSKPN